MTTTELLIVAGLVIQSVGLGVILFKLVWGSGTNLQQQFNTISSAFSDRVLAIKDDWQVKFDGHTLAFGQTVQAIHDRFHQIELAAMKFQRDAAETYMRRESYYQASVELKRDVQAANADLKQEVHAGFEKLEKQIDELAKTVHQRGGA
jgi:hypothetical protein